jgi:hypothetical protein
MSFRLALAALPLATLASGAALGCEPIYSSDPQEWARADTRLELRPDCSFENASFGVQESGAPVRDRGNMRIAQRLSYADGCNQTEQMLVVDCSTGDLAVFEGEPGPNPVSIGGGPFTSIKYIQKPLGPLNVTSKTTVADLIAAAEKHGIEYFPDFVARQKKEKRKNRYDAYCGCRLYYPESVGADMAKP